MSHHVIKGRQLVFGSPPLAAGAGATKRRGFPVGIIIRCITIGTSFHRPLQNGEPKPIRQGNYPAPLVPPHDPDRFARP
jgi:hypothetical protein